MRRIMLTVAYDGTGYSGWQIQPEKETVEGVLSREIGRLLNEDTKVIGASRTDAGVHALGAVCVFDTDSRIPADKFPYAINRSLPDDIVVRASREVAPDFHPRRCDSVKTYRYTIWHDRLENPLISRYSYRVYTDLDIREMERACGYFLGEHDFKAFCSAGSDVETTIRTIYDLHMETEGYDVSDMIPKEANGKRIDIFVSGSGFLYNMVRIIAGTLVDRKSVV